MHSPNPYMLLDRELKFVWANEAYLKVTDRQWDDIRGRELFEAFPSEGESHEQLKSRSNTSSPPVRPTIAYLMPFPCYGGMDTHV